MIHLLDISHNSTIYQVNIKKHVLVFQAGRRIFNPSCIRSDKVWTNFLGCRVFLWVQVYKMSKYNTSKDHNVIDLGLSYVIKEYPRHCISNISLMRDTWAYLLLSNHKVFSYLFLFLPSKLLESTDSSTELGIISLFLPLFLVCVCGQGCL